MMNSEVEKLDIRLKAVNDLYKQGREEMLLEMTNFATQIARIQVLAESLRDGHSINWQVKLNYKQWNKVTIS